MRKQNPKSYDYIESLMSAESKAMQQSRAGAEQLGLEAISLSATEGNLLPFFLNIIKAKKVVEIGTLTGLSANYILKALPSDGFLWTLEKSDEHAKFAAQALADEIKNKRCKIIVGDAQQKLFEIASNGPFDAVFIDGNKAAYLDYFQWAVANTGIGAMIIVDNIFLSGAVWGDVTSQKFNAKQIQAVQKMNQMAFSNEALSSVIVPTQEGLLICFKKASTDGL